MKTNTFLSGMTTGDVQTENGMPAHSTSDSNVLDLFFLLGTRPQDSSVAKAVIGAVAENPSLTAKALFQSRDVRGGKGERQSFRVGFQQLPDKAKKLVKLIPEFGRWDDVLSLLDHKIFGPEALKVISKGLTSGDSLCAKWMPRKGPVAERLRNSLGLSPKGYRKLLVNLTHVVESQMCAKQWAEINYSHVPSRAGMIYAKAFNRHDTERYQAWRESLTKPESGAKINVGALYPHEVVAQARNNSQYPFEAAWSKMLENFPPIEEKVLAVCDVSGSMTGLPMDVSVALGLFLSQRNTGPFKDCFCTFSEVPMLQRLHGTLLQRIHQLEFAEWGMNTNLEAVLQLIVNAASKAKKTDIPSVILILSDMQFDGCVNTPSVSALKMIDAQFAAVGVPRPKVVFWNLRESGVGQTLPVKAKDKNTALVSGFSPTILKGLLGNPKDFTPYGIMLQTLNAPRYSEIKL